METKVFLQRYRLSLGRNGLPVELHRTPRGITYRAQEIASGREVAIELVPWSQAQPAASARMQTAATAARQINHVNLPALHDFGIEDEQLVYVTDSFDGHTAEAWVAARGPLPLGAVLRVALQVAAALGAASFHRIQHPAINPANIIFVPGQTAEGDWPAIKVLHWLGPNEAIAEGTDARADAAARYASPEQLRGGEADFASSIFSLGCTMWFLLTGTPPAVPGATGVRASVAHLRGVPKIVRHLLGRMLRVERAERPQDPVVLQAYLQTCLGRVDRRDAMSRRLGVPLLATAARAVAARPGWKLRGRPLAIAAIVLLLGTVAVVALPRVIRARRLAVNAFPREEAVNQETPNETLEEPVPPSEGPESVVMISPEEQSTPEPTLLARAEPPSPAVAPMPEVAEVSSSSPVAAPIESIAPPPKMVAAPMPAPNGSEIVSALPAREIAVGPAPAENPSPVVIEATPSPLPSATPRPEKTEIASQPLPRKSRKTIAVAERKKSSIHARSKRGIARAEVRRGRKIPQLRVGSNRAELVGTTADGRWILSVSSSGERIVVPPPPGYAR